MTDETLLFAKRDNPRSRAELVDRYDHLATRLARKFVASGESLEDLTQVARLGILNAIDRFDPERGVAFATFASRTIVGELKRHLRDKAWAVRVPRGLKERSLEIGEAVQRLSQSLGRSPTLREIASEIGAAAEQVIEALEAGDAYRAASLDAPIGAADGTAAVVDTIGSSDAELQRTPSRVTAAEAIEQLPERDREILRLRFFEGESQSRIAAQVGISQMHVSRVLRAALQQLRETVSAP